MRVFLTGATGMIGAAVSAALTRAGHRVTALLRTPSKRPLVEERGAYAHPGDLSEPDSYGAEAARHDVLIHAAIDYGGDTVGADLTAVATLLDALRAEGGCARRLLYTSGCWILGDTGADPADENASTEGAWPPVLWRRGPEREVLTGAPPGATTAVLRPGIVYGGAGSLTAGWYRGATERGAAPLIGDGDNHWSFVRLEDLAALYVALAESTAADVFHGVDNRPVRAADAAVAASRAAGAGGRVRRLTLEQGRASLGPVADALVMNQRLITTRAAEVGWTPACASYLECVEEDFAEWLAAR